MRIKQFVFVLLVLVFGVAFAQATDPTSPGAFDFAAAFANTAALAALVAALVSFLKAHVLKSLDGLGTVLASLVVGGVLGFLGHWTGYLQDGLMPALGFGVSAGLVASGGWDAVKGLLSKRQAG